MQDVTEDMIVEVFRQPMLRPVTLVTLHDGGLPAPVYLCDCQDFLAGTARRGFVSREQEYAYVAFSAGWVGAGDDAQARQVQLSIGNADGRIARAVRAADPLPLLDVEIVRRAAPDLVERAMRNVALKSVDIDGPSVRGVLKPRSFADTPAVFARATLARLPALG